MPAIIVAVGCQGEVLAPTPVEPGTAGATGIGGAPSTAGAPQGAGTTAVASGGASGSGNGGASGGGGVSVVAAGTTATGGSQAVPTPVLDSGRTVLRRLTRAEYNNTVRDLLLTDLRPGDQFSDADTVADEGFDSIGAVLSMPPILVEQYEAAATVLIDELFARPAGDTARSTLLPCTITDQACATSIVQSFARRAFRRTPTAAEVDRLMALRATVDALGAGPDEGLKAALRGVLLSPQFAFRVEKRPVGDTSAQPLAQTEVATRLSYLLWASMPDEPLLAAAESGTLTANLPAEVARMLADPKAHEFVVNFGGQWLGLRNMETLEPPSTLVFPEYDTALRDAAKQESLAFFELLITGQKPLTDLLIADYTVLNARLAQHYGISVTGTDFQQVSLASTPRRGFLTHASFLMNSSHPGSTSPPRRGSMVLERLMCTVIPPPPMDVDVDLPPLDPGMTRREQLELHRSEPRCAGCHSLMDPIGFGFENYDGVGAYRTTEDNGQPIDATGALPTPQGDVAFNTPVELETLLAQDERFPACVTEKLLTYAVGRSFAEADAKAYTSALAQAAILSGKSDWRAWIEYLVTSEAFLTARGEAL